MIKVNIVNMDAQVYTTSALSISVPGERGLVSIGAKQAPEISLLKAGDIKVQLQDGHNHLIPINGGVMEITPYIVTVLTN